jgi:hypothetical protein
LFEHAQAQQIVRGVTLGGRGEQVPHQQCQPGVMAEIERSEALVVIETRDRFQAGLGEV